jgi:hypothetical protein
MNNNWNLNDNGLNHSPSGDGGSSSGDGGNMELRLWEYIDGISDEPSVIEKLIAESREWKEKYTALLEVHNLVQATELEEPSLRFTKNVMEEIARLQITPAAKKYINTKIIWGIAAFFIVGFLVYGLSQINWVAGSSSGGGRIDFTAVDYSRIFNNSFVNLFMMLNVVLGLMLLDRYLATKRKKFFER